MKRNVGTIDRTLRVLLGVTLLALAFFGTAPFFDVAAVRYGAVAAGCVMLLVAGLRLCPLYSLFGIKTCGV